MPFLYGNPVVVDNVAWMILLDRKIAYVLTDRNLKVVEVGGLTEIFQRAPEDCLGHALIEVVQELEGNEETLIQVLNGELPRFKLAWVNRELPDGETVYLTMIQLPFRDESGEITGLLHFTHDVTETGLLGQRLTQERNELRLVKERLAGQYRQLTTANSELQRLDEVKSAFIAIAAS